jgi:hypothetical protein
MYDDIAGDADMHFRAKLQEPLHERSSIHIDTDYVL